MIDRFRAGLAVLALIFLTSCATGADRGSAADSEQLDPKDPQIVQVVEGDGHMCALAQSGHVFCWGDNDHGQLGDGTQIARSAPVAVKGLDDAVDLTAGANHNCAVRGNGHIACWGRNDRQQIGIVNRGMVSKAIATPTEPRGIRTFEPGGLNVYRPQCRGQVTDIEEVRAKRHQTCAVHRSGGVLCWGANEQPTLGVRSDTENRAVVGCPAVVKSGPPAHIFEQDNEDAPSLESVSELDFELPTPESDASEDAEADAMDEESCAERVVFGDDSAPNSITFRQGGMERVLRFEQMGAKISRGQIYLTFPTLQIGLREGVYDQRKITTHLRDMEVRATLPKDVGARPDEEHTVDAQLHTSGWRPSWPYLGRCLGAHFQQNGQMTITHFEEPEPNINGTGRVEATLRFSTGDPALGSLEAQLVVTDFATENRVARPDDAGPETEYVTATYDPMDHSLQFHGRGSVQSMGGGIDGEGIFASSSFGDTTVFVLKELSPFEVRADFWEIEDVEVDELVRAQRANRSTSDNDQAHGPQSFFSVDTGRSSSKKARLESFEPGAHGATLDRRVFATKIRFGPDLHDEFLVPGARGTKVPDPWLERADELRANAQPIVGSKTVLMEQEEDASDDRARSLFRKREVVSLAGVTRDGQRYLATQYRDKMSQRDSSTVLLDPETLLPVRREQTANAWYKGKGSTPTEIVVEYRPGQVHVSAQNEVQGAHEKSFDVPEPSIDRQQLLATIPYLPLEPGYRTGYGLFDLRLDQAPRRMTFSWSHKDGESTSTEPRLEDAKPYRIRASVEDGRLVVLGERLVSLNGREIEALEVLLLEGQTERRLLVEREAPHHLLRMDEHDSTFVRETRLEE